MINDIEKSAYKRKIINTVSKYLKDIKNPIILEFGVRKGISTGFFLDLCKSNKGKLFSVDIDDCSGLFKDENWTFIKCRDDDIKNIENTIDTWFCPRCVADCFPFSHLDSRKLDKVMNPRPKALGTRVTTNNKVAPCPKGLLYSYTPTARAVTSIVTQRAMFFMQKSLSKK